MKKLIYVAVVLISVNSLAVSWSYDSARDACEERLGANFSKVWKDQHAEDLPLGKLSVSSLQDPDWVKYRGSQMGVLQFCESANGYLEQQAQTLSRELAGSVQTLDRLTLASHVLYLGQLALSLHALTEVSPPIPRIFSLGSLVVCTALWREIPLKEDFAAGSNLKWLKKNLQLAYDGQVAYFSNVVIFSAFTLLFVGARYQPVGG